MSNPCKVTVRVGNVTDTFDLALDDPRLGQLLAASSLRELSLSLPPTDEVATLLGKLRYLPAPEITPSIPPVELSSLSEEDQKRIRMLSRRVDELDLSVRSGTCINNRDCVYIWEVCTMTEGDWLKVKNFGRKSLKELVGLLRNIGLALGMSEQIQTWKHFLPAREARSS